ncbi:MAG: hypothetical protein JNL10_10425 [Verrucomicrobiales bacterium]|nr:hypothetical protein [Verrucomicrobiales bacterium]
MNRRPKDLTRSAGTRTPVGLSEGSPVSGSAARWGLPLLATAWVILSLPIRAGESAQASPVKPKDLTDMSLENLLESEITPINVLGSHTHLAGEWMVGFRYMFTDMNQNYVGSHKVSPAQVLEEYPMVHTRMTMQMEMVELMYAPLDDLNFMAMVPFEQMTMDHIMDDGETFTAKSGGIGDLNLMSLINVYGNPRERGNRLVLNAGLTVPTGSINQTSTRSGVPRRLEYWMQLGSGTVNLEPGLAYLGESENWAWGVHGLGVLPVGYNENDYRLGSQYFVDAWAEYKVANWFGPSLRFNWRQCFDIHGADPDLDPALNPAFDAQMQAGERLDAVFGLNFYIPHGVLKGNRFSVEGGLPMYQNIDGPNLGIAWFITAGWSYTFH